MSTTFIFNQGFFDLGQLGIHKAQVTVGILSAPGAPLDVQVNKATVTVNSPSVGAQSLDVTHVVSKSVYWRNLIMEAIREVREQEYGD